MQRLMNSFVNYFKPIFFGFIQGHHYLTLSSLKTAKSIIGRIDNPLVASYEKQFAKKVGPGKAISYASARMGFYELMRIIGVRPGDEIILLGATCAVMVNAVLKIGAVPKFSDIDIETFGSNKDSIGKLINSNTKMIVAQHSFGIPCDIIPIQKLAKSKKIFLLEDCALTFGSELQGLGVGNYSDAALFSTDHSKPINTIIGGLVYTNDEKLFSRLRSAHEKIPELSLKKQNALWTRLLIERINCTPERYGRMKLINLFCLVLVRLGLMEDPFLSSDFGSMPGKGYPYPAKLPAFLAFIGIQELKRWSTVSQERIALLKKIIEIALDSGGLIKLPFGYVDKTKKVVPLRFAWIESQDGSVNQRMKDFLDLSWVWFREPIIATKTPLVDFGYSIGCCPTSEFIGPRMVNLPCNVPLHQADLLVKLFRKSIL